MPRPKKDLVIGKPKNYRKQAKGKGSFKSFFSKVANAIPKGSFSQIGEILGGPAGRIIGSLASKVTGMGAYKSNKSIVRHNALFKTAPQGNSVQIPQFSPGRHGVQVAHSEYIGDLLCGTSTPSIFTLSDFDINPGLATTFPWLSQIAQNFESYRFHGLVFEFKSLCTDNTATFAGLGSVIMAAQYNSANSNFVNKFQMENYDGAVSCKPSQSMVFGVECDPRDIPENHLYIRSGDLAANQDIKTYDMGQMQIASVGCPVASQQLGEIWVSYIVDLMSPKLYAGQLGYGINQAHYSSSTAVSTSAYFGTSQTEKFDNMGLAFGTATITFPANIVTGTYQLLYNVVGTAASAAQITITATTNCTKLNLINADTESVFAIQYGASQTKMSTGVYFTISGPSAVLTFSGGTLPSSITQMDIFIQQCNALMTT